MITFIRILRRRPILSPVVITLVIAVVNLLTYYLYEETSFASLNMIMSAMFYGSILFPAYYALTFAYFFACIYYINSAAKYFIVISLILYIVFTIPFIDMSLLTFGF